MEVQKDRPGMGESGFPKCAGPAGKLSTADRATGFVHKDSLSLDGHNFGPVRLLSKELDGWVDGHLVSAGATN